MDRGGWSVLDDARGVWWREYEFSRGAWATTLAIKTPDGVVVLSPAAGLEPAAYDALGELGRVRALVATNAMHHMGQAAWRARFPDAESFAPPRSVPVLVRKTPTIPFHSLAELALPPDVRWEDPPGFKDGETLLSIEGTRGPIWFTGDLVTNIQRTPGPPLRWLFTLTGSAFGLRLFKLGVWTMVSDRAAVRRWMEGQLERFPAQAIVPAHGPPIEAEDLRERLETELRKL